MKIEKSIEDLTIDDFEKSPRWMFYGGKEGEFDPFVIVVPEDHEDFDPKLICLVKATYRLNNGREFQGYFYDADDREEHTIFIGSSGLSTWWGVAEPSASDIQEVYRNLSMTADQLFPIEYTSFDGNRTGAIEGFYFIDGDSVKVKK